MHAPSVGLFGASGYSGMEAARLLAHHPGVRLAFLAGDRWRGESARSRLGLSGPAGKLCYLSAEEGLSQAKECEVALLATPPEASLTLVPTLLEAGLRVVDLSGAFRLKDPSLYPVHYGWSHPAPGLLAEAVYGLPELFRKSVLMARLVANPGCYPTAVALALAPPLRAGLLEGDLVVDAASGVTGAGRKASEELSFAEVDEDYRAYRVGRHQHAPEISQTLGASDLVFTTHLLPVRRGILVTAHARLKDGVDSAAVSSAYADAFTGEPFVELVPSPDQVGLKQVVGSNRCRIGFLCQGRRLIVVAALDNLLKGAAGQAVQNLNLLLGRDETEGLE